jgi:hypothetical protein
VNEGQKSIICNDKNTLLDYTFEFTGTLGSWRSYLKGKQSGTINGDVTLTLNSTGVTYNPSTNVVTVSYTIQPNAAPTLLSPSGIVIPEIKGYSTLFLEVAGQTFSKELTVVGNCNQIGL